MRTALAFIAALAFAACQRVEGPAPAEVPGAELPAPAHAGSAFMAIGQEPGWRVEVRPGPPPRLTGSLDYGNRQVEVANAAVTADGWSGRTADGTPVALRFLRKPCEDAMSGEAFEAEATLTVAGEAWHGCGRFALR